jgi:predicted nucleic acid-binding protein
VILPRSFVIDASVVAAIFLPDETSPLAAAIREQWTELTLVAPRALRLEFLNLMLNARRRGRIDARLFEGIVIEAAHFPVTYDDAEVPLLDLATAAYDLGLTSYDHAYVDCARRRGLPLATADKAMTGACAVLGVGTVTNDLTLHEPRVPYVAAAISKKAPRARSRAR